MHHCVIMHLHSLIQIFVLCDLILFHPSKVYKNAEFESKQQTIYAFSVGPDHTGKKRQGAASGNILICSLYAQVARSIKTYQYCAASLAVSLHV